MFENINGAKEVDLSEYNYLNYFAEWRKALFATGDYKSYYDFLCSVFMENSTNLTLKLYVCNDLLRLLTITEQETFLTDECLKFLKETIRNYPKGKHTVQIINNIVFTSLEFNKEIAPELLKAFVPTIPLHPCNTATYGLYLLKVKHNIERGLSYYDRAIAMAQKDSIFSYLIEELKVKKEIENAKSLMFTGDFNSAKRLLEGALKRVGKPLQSYQQSIARLLAEC